MADKWTAPRILAAKQSSRRSVCITAYDAPTAIWADEAGVDLILVGDSIGNVVLGFDSTLSVDMEDMIRATSAVARTKPNALLVADMPFGSYQLSPEQAVDSAILLVKAGAEAVKIEGGYVEAICAVLKAGIPVMGHVGMTPQSVHAFGGFRVQGKGDAGESVFELAKALDDSGVFSIVLELIPTSLSARITDAVKCPTIGIGAGIACNGQIQVMHDVLGLHEGHFKHAKRYFEGKSAMVEALRQYAEEVRNEGFPGSEHSF